MKYSVTIKTRPTKVVISIFPLILRVLVYNVHNQLHITFGTDVVDNKALKARNSTPTHRNF
jgi:hypothetical protein